MYHKGTLVFVKYLDKANLKKRGRPAVIVSGDTYNSRSNNVAVAYLSSRPDSYGEEYHVPISSSGRLSYVVAETFSSVPKSRILSVGLGKLTELELEEVDKAIRRALDL